MPLHRPGAPWPCPVRAPARRAPPSFGRVLGGGSSIALQRGDGSGEVAGRDRPGRRVRGRAAFRHEGGSRFIALLAQPGAQSLGIVRQPPSDQPLNFGPLAVASPKQSISRAPRSRRICAGPADEEIRRLCALAQIHGGTLDAVRPRVYTGNGAGTPSSSSLVPGAPRRGRAVGLVAADVVDWTKFLELWVGHYILDKARLVPDWPLGDSTP